MSDREPPNLRELDSCANCKHSTSTWKLHCEKHEISMWPSSYICDDYEAEAKDETK